MQLLHHDTRPTHPGRAGVDVAGMWALPHLAYDLLNDSPVT